MDEKVCGFEFLIFYESFQPLQSSPFFYAVCKAATGECSDRLNKVMHRCSIIIIIAYFFFCSESQRSEQHCWSSAGTDSTSPGWRWDAGARGTSSSRSNTRGSRTRSRWGRAAWKYSRRGLHIIILCFTLNKPCTRWYRLVVAALKNISEKAAGHTFVYF